MHSDALEFQSFYSLKSRENKNNDLVFQTPHCCCCSSKEDRCSSEKNRSIPSLPAAASLVCVFATFLQLFYSPSTDSRLACTFRCLLRCFFLYTCWNTLEVMIFHFFTRKTSSISIISFNNFYLHCSPVTASRRPRAHGEDDEWVWWSGADWRMSWLESYLWYTSRGILSLLKTAGWRNWMIQVILNWIKQNEK